MNLKEVIGIPWSQTQSLCLHAQNTMTYPLVTENFIISAHNALSCQVLVHKCLYSALLPLGILDQLSMVNKSNESYNQDAERKQGCDPMLVMP